MGIESPLASCGWLITGGARSNVGTRDRPWYAKPMKRYFVSSRNKFLISSCSSDDVRCSEGTATMLTSDVLHGHARHQRRRSESLHHLACLACRGAPVHAHDSTCTSCGSATPVFPAYSTQLDRTTTRPRIKATTYMRLSEL